MIAGQQTALGVSIQGISQKQLQTLKTRMEATKATLEKAQAALENQREQILKDMTGEHLAGDMLTATLWSYFASLQSYGFTSGKAAEVIDLPSLQYGLFHAQVKPRKIWGLVTNGVSFTGLNMDVGHIRSIRWVKDDNPVSLINSDPELITKSKTAAQNRWIIYNKGKGQHSSAMEHAVPEEFWIDKSQCKYTDESGQIQNPNVNACIEGVSAVKAIAVAQAQGQKIYTITPENRATALPKLSIGGSVGEEIISAINAGKEVTFHERAIDFHGWKGYGYIINDTNTGVGAYLIEGGGNGGELSADDEKTLALISGIILGVSIGLVSLLIGSIAFIFIVLFALAIILAAWINYQVWSDDADVCFAAGGGIGASFTRLGASKTMKQFLERIFLLVTGGAVGSQIPKIKDCF